MAEKANKANWGLITILIVDIAVLAYFGYYISWLRTEDHGWYVGVYINSLMALATISIALRSVLITALALRRWWSRDCMLLRLPLWVCSVMLMAITREEVDSFTPIFIIIMSWDVAALAIPFLVKSIREQFPPRPSSTAQSQFESTDAVEYPNVQMPIAGQAMAQGNANYGQSLPQQPGAQVAETQLSPCPHCSAQNPPDSTHCSLCLTELAAVSSPGSDKMYAVGQPYETVAHSQWQPRPSGHIMRSRAYLKSGKPGKWGTRCAVVALILILSATVLPPIAAQILYEGYEQKADGASYRKIIDMKMKVITTAFALGFLSIPFGIIGLILAPRNPETGRRRKKSLAFIVGVIFIVLVSITLILGFIIMGVLLISPW